MDEVTSKLDEMMCSKSSPLITGRAPTTAASAAANPCLALYIQTTNPKVSIVRCQGE
jgi:hypothetical protein